jgi:hypothetical protein
MIEAVRNGARVEAHEVMMASRVAESLTRIYPGY